METIKINTKQLETWLKDQSMMFLVVSPSHLLLFIRSKAQLGQIVYHFLRIDYNYESLFSFSVHIWHAIFQSIRFASVIMLHVDPFYESSRRPKKKTIAMPSFVYIFDKRAGKITIKMFNPSSLVVFAGHRPQSVLWDSSTADAVWRSIAGWKPLIMIIFSLTFGGPLL